jgi:hypothetical protein
MERIHYGSHVFCTGTEIAGAVLDYAGLLAAAGRFAMVDIPIIAVDGGPSKARLLLGPSMPIASESVSAPMVELLDDGAVATLRDAALVLSAPPLVPTHAAPARIDRRKTSMIDDWLELDAD